MKYYDENAKQRIICALSTKTKPECVSGTSSEAHHEAHHDVLHDVPCDVYKNNEEIDFLRQQILSMNEQIASRDEQIRQQGELITSLNGELEKEREHNREKDRQLMDTLSKLAETQAAMAVWQSAEKQMKLAETIIEGQQQSIIEQKVDDVSTRIDSEEDTGE